MLWYLETVLLRQAYLPSNMLWYLETVLLRQAYLPSNMLWYLETSVPTQQHVMVLRDKRTYPATCYGT